MVAEETERYTKEVKTLKEQVTKLQTDLKYTKVRVENYTVSLYFILTFPLVGLE